MTRWFSSDFHLAHENIIKYQNRPFKNSREMGEALLTYHNELVKPEDHWSCLGDVTIRRGGRQDKEWFIKEIRKYNGHKRLYLGNHDHFPIQVYLDAGFEKIYATWRDEGRILWSHIPVHPNSIGSAIANVHGHTHSHDDYEPVRYENKEGRQIIKPFINISVERTAYRPISIDEVCVRIDKGLRR